MLNLSCEADAFGQAASVQAGSGSRADASSSDPSFLAMYQESAAQMRISAVPMRSRVLRRVLLQRSASSLLDAMAINIGHWTFMRQEVKDHEQK